MPWSTDWTPGAKIQVLIFGASKAGKTYGAYTFPRPVVMDFDRGIAVANNPDFITKHGLRKFFYEQFNEAKMQKGVPLDHNAFDDACRFYDEWMKPEGTWKGTKVGVGQFDTWVIDSGTTLSEIAQNKAVVLMGRMNLSKTHKEAITSGLVIPKIQDYGSERSLVEQFVDMVLSSGKHVVLICHEKEVTDDSGTVLRIEPLLTGKSSEVVPQKFDEVYNLRVRKVGMEFKRTLLTQADGLRKVGSRYGVPSETEWSFEALTKALNVVREQRDKLMAPSQKPEAPIAATAAGR